MAGNAENQVENMAKGQTVSKPLPDSSRYSINSRRQEGAFQALFNSSLIGIYIIQNGKFQFVNPRFQEYIGYSEQELLGRDSLSFVHPEDRGKVRENAVKMLRGEQSAEYKFRIVTRSGETRWIMEAITSVEYLGSRATLGNFMDITSHNQTEEALREKNEQLDAQNEELQLQSEEMLSQQQELTDKTRELEKTNLSLKEREHDLRERVKELGCLYGIARIMEKTDIPLNDQYQEVVNLLRNAWQYPEVTCTRIIIDDIKVETDNYRETKWKQSSDITVYGKKAGTVQVYYLEERPVIDEGPFSKEERLLIDAVAERLGRVTERNQAEEALRQSEENLKAYLENAPDAVYLNDLKGNFLYGNKIAEKLTGYKREELIGKSFLKLNLLPAKYWKKAGKLLALSAIGRPTGPDELELVRMDGSRIWTSISTTPIKQEGKIIVIGFVRDITERKQAEEALRESEQRFRDLFENASDLIQSVTTDGHFIYVNRAWRETLGYTQEEIAGLSMLDIIHLDSQAHCMEVFQRVMSGENIEGIEAAFVTKDGRKIMVEGNANCKFTDGKPVATRGIFRDITERKRAEEALHELSRMKNEFISSISHELRTPLHSIEGFIKLLLEDQAPDPETRKEFLGIIDTQSTHLGQLIDNLLDVSRLESARFEIHRRNTRVKNLLQNTVDSFYSLANEKDITVSMDIPQTLPRMEIDEERIRQVMINLLGNAIKFSDTGGRVSVKARVNGPELLVHVSDTGIGIPAKAVPHLFEQFFRVESTNKVEGTGLGLYISRQIIELHGGRIWAKSTEGKGSTFTFALPLEQTGGNAHEKEDIGYRG
ncbi:PAS domain S-box protein [Chloroflexota bacterium]